MISNHTFGHYRKPTCKNGCTELGLCLLKQFQSAWKLIDYVSVVVAYWSTFAYLHTAIGVRILVWKA